jgi:hypothetical protein
MQGFRERAAPRDEPNLSDLDLLDVPRRPAAVPVGTHRPPAGGLDQRWLGVGGVPNRETHRGPHRGRAGGGRVALTTMAHRRLSGSIATHRGTHHPAIHGLEPMCVELEDRRSASDVGLSRHAAGDRAAPSLAFPIWSRLSSERSPQTLSPSISPLLVSRSASVLAPFVLVTLPSLAGVRLSTERARATLSTLARSTLPRWRSSAASSRSSSATVRALSSSIARGTSAGGCLRRSDLLHPCTV